MKGVRRLLVYGGCFFCALYMVFLHLESSYSYNVSPHIDNPGPTKNKVPLVKSTNKAIVHKQSGFKKTSPSGKVAVVLNCEGRSGSTWLSSLFWNNPNVFYVYEPLYPSDSNDAYMKAAGLSERQGYINQLADSYSCRLDRNKGETPFPMVIGRYPTYQPELKHCHKTNSCPTSLTSFCSARSHVVQKVIRVFNISDFKALQEKLDIPVKVIHLVRDPRPTIMSRERMFTWMLKESGPDYKDLPEDAKSWERRQVCERVLNNIKLGDSSFFPRDNYIRVSHEEMSLSPITWARRLYEFTGLEFTSETEEYINKITHGSSAVANGKDPDGRFAMFSVYRDTLKILYKWIGKNPGHVHEIERECKGLLDYLGYVPLYNDKLEKITDDPWPLLKEENLE